MRPLAKRDPGKTPLPPVTLILGGARSGKSAYGEALVEAEPGACVYLATAEAGDGEMAQRIARHRARRGGRWRTIEEPLALPETLAEATRPDATVLVDCLTLWLSNLLLAERDPEAETAALVDRLSQLAGPVILIGNEVGLGIVPENALARRFRDAAGQLNQAVAAAAARVVLVTAGLPQILKNDVAEHRCPS
jgi:adenosylcobinamide kinase/adenosylcobinamide-phosphate guanylyltransferase